MAEHETREGVGVVGGAGARDLDEALRLHHLATADPEPERGDGLLTGPAHEEKYGLERAERSAELWRGAGVHPTENRALRPGEPGHENLRGVASPDGLIETTSDEPPARTNAAPRASDVNKK